MRRAVVVVGAYGMRTLLVHSYLLQVKYSSLISGLAAQNVGLNRKMLSELAQSEPFSFKALVDQVVRMRGLSAGSAAKPSPSA